MIHKAEVYAQHRFLGNITLFFTNEEHIITVVPKNRNHFIFFYPDEILTIRYMDEDNLLHIHEVTFLEIKMIRTKTYYQFEILSSLQFEHMKNSIRKKKDLHVLISDFHSLYQSKASILSDTHLQIYIPHQLPHEFVEVFWYQGKKRFKVLCQIEEVNQRTEGWLCDILILQREVI